MDALPRLSHAGAIDADGHILEPPDLWERYLEPSLRARALCIRRDERGLEYLEIDGRASKLVRNGMPAGLTTASLSPQPNAGFRSGSTPPSSRSGPGALRRDDELARTTSSIWTGSSRSCRTRPGPRSSAATRSGRTIWTSSLAEHEENP